MLFEFFGYFYLDVVVGDDIILLASSIKSDSSNVQLEDIHLDTRECRDTAVRSS